MKKVAGWFKKQNKYFLVGLAMTGLAVVLGILSFFWTPYGPTTMSAAERFNAPSFGTFSALTTSAGISFRV